MTVIPANYPKPDTEYNCQCGEKEDMEHIYNCGKLNNGTKNKLKYEKLFCGTLSEQIEIFRIFENNLKRREKLKCNIPCDPPCDPLSSVMG